MQKTYLSVNCVFMQDYLSEIEPYQDVVLSCTTASSRITHVAGVADEAGKIQQKWDGAVHSIKDHHQLLEKSLKTWTTFESQQQELRKVLETAQIGEPNLTAVNLEYLQSQIICYEVMLLAFYYTGYTLACFLQSSALSDSNFTFSYATVCGWV